MSWSLCIGSEGVVGTVARSWQVGFIGSKRGGHVDYDHSTAELPTDASKPSSQPDDAVDPSRGIVRSSMFCCWTTDGIIRYRRMRGWFDFVALR